MQRLALILATLAALAGCASSGANDGVARQAGYQDTSSGGGASAGQIAVSVIGTPFYLVFKGAVCGATLVVAGPAAAFFALTPQYRDDAMRSLGEGLEANCGPPYVLSPASLG
jgi:hypothetical protein